MSITPEELEKKMKELTEREAKMNKELEASQKKRINWLQDQILSFKKDEELVIRSINNEEALESIAKKRKVEKDEEESKKKEKKTNFSQGGAIFPNPDAPKNEIESFVNNDSIGTVPPAFLILDKNNAKFFQDVGKDGRVAYLPPTKNNPMGRMVA